MKFLTVKPGNVIATTMSGYQHWSIVSDKICPLGKPMLISATKRSGTVLEEPWDTVVGGRETVVVDMELRQPVSEILAFARSHIGMWKYSITDRNCEHFVKSVNGYEITSKQVQAGVVGAIAGVGLVGSLSENPNLIKFLGAAVLVAGIAVYAVRVTEK